MSTTPPSPPNNVPIFDTHGRLVDLVPGPAPIDLNDHKLDYMRLSDDAKGMGRVAFKKKYPGWEEMWPAVVPLPEWVNIPHPEFRPASFRSLPGYSAPTDPPRTPTEEKQATIWAEVLGGGIRKIIRRGKSKRKKSKRRISTKKSRRKSIKKSKKLSRKRSKKI